MEVRATDLDAVPAENLHVPAQEFADVWVAAEARAGKDWKAYGVAQTCRWLAGATVRPDSQPWHSAPAPVTQRTARRATPELIEQECVAADVLAHRDPPPAWLADRPGWLEGVCVTFDWAWRRRAPAPLGVTTPPA